LSVWDFLPDRPFEWLLLAIPSYCILWSIARPRPEDSANSWRYPPCLRRKNVKQESPSDEQTVKETVSI
jgi:hypothetical protein